MAPQSCLSLKQTSGLLSPSISWSLAEGTLAVGVQVTSHTLGGSCLHRLVHPLGQRDLGGEPKPQDHLRAGFLILGTIHIWGWIILYLWGVGGNHPVYYRMLTSIPSLTP